ncbi:hypothetical protein L2755_08215 [Shewanella abyssi]|uniref:hypothetical protein n=1 Tax=Shewanella abyssi TaxID=311789 RepID=UPI00200DD854|nr:hypothetical protein [Shewanella abyssi]MCL1049600.1 hypothetical protein [Shewanella abyssi]
MPTYRDIRKHRHKHYATVGWALAHQSLQSTMLTNGINADLQKIIVNTNISITTLL